MEKNGTFASPATALARSVLPVLQEIHDFHHFLLGAIQAGDILESDLDLVLVGQLAGGLAHIEGIAHSAAHAAGSPVHSAEHPNPEKDQQQRREDPLGQFGPGVVRILDDHLELLAYGQRLIEFGETRFGVEFGGDQEIEMRGAARNHPTRKLIGILGQALGTDLDLATDVIADENDFLDVSGLGHGLDLLPFDLLRVGGLLVVEQQPTDPEDQQKV